MKKIKEKYIKIIFVLIMFTVCLTWSIFQPFNQGPDEHMKMDICKYLLEHNSLPHGGDEEIRNNVWGISYGFTPILSYMISALFMRIAMIFTTNETVLLTAGRLASILSYTGTVIMIMKIAEKIFNKKDIFKWLFIVLVSCLPQFVFLGTYLNNDSLAIFSASIILYSWIIGLQSNWNIKSCILLGVGVGICALSYYNCYGFILTSIILYIASFFIKKKGKIEEELTQDINITEKQVTNKEEKKVVKTEGPVKFDFKNFFKKAIIISIIALLIAGWWFIRNAIIYNGDFIGMKTSDEYAEKYAMEEYKPSQRETPYKQGFSLLYMLTGMNWITQTAFSFIGVFGNMSQQMPYIVYLAYLILFIIGFIGVIYYLIRNIKNKQYKENKNKLLLQIILVLNIIIPICLSLYYSYCSDFQPQGRYIMPMLIPFMYFITIGIKALIQKLCKNERVIKYIIIFLSMMLFIVPIICLFRYVIFKY